MQSNSEAMLACMRSLFAASLGKSERDPCLPGERHYISTSPDNGILTMKNKSTTRK